MLVPIVDMPIRRVHWYVYPAYYTVTIGLDSMASKHIKELY